MRDAGAANIIAIVKEDIGYEVEDFKRDFWSEDVYVDKEWAFYRALGDGEARQPDGMWSFMMKALCPCIGVRLKENLEAAKDIKTNYNGEGFVAGGFYVLNTDGSVAFADIEEEYGDRVDVDQVIKVIAAVA